MAYRFIEGGLKPEEAKAAETERKFTAPGRTTYGGILRGLESMGGFPGMAQKGIGQAISYLSKDKITPEQGSEMIGHGIQRLFPIAGSAMGMASDVLRGEKPTGETVLPTPSQLRTTTQKLTGQTFEPQSKGEEKAQNVVSNITQYATLPFLKGGVTSYNAAKNILGGAMEMAMGGEAARSAAEGLGFKEGGQAVAEFIGAGLGGVARNIPRAKPLVEKQYNKFMNLFKQRPGLKTNSLQEGVDWVARNTSDGLTKAEKIARKIAKDKGRIFSKNSINPAKLEKLRQGLNQEIYGDNRSWELATSIKKELEPIYNAIDDTFKKGFPEDFKAIKSTRDMYHTFKKVDKYLGFIDRNNITKVLKHPLSIYFFAKNPFKILKGAGALFAGKPIIEVAYTALKDPTFRKLYFNSFKELAKKSVTGSSTAIRKVDDYLQKNKPTKEKGKYKMYYTD